MNELLDVLHKRHSTPASQLVEPGPNDEQLKSIVQCGLTAPDHAKLCPWQFITIRGNARNALAEVFAQAAKSREPEISEQQLERLREKPLRSPIILVAVAEITPDHPKTPEVEQLASTAAAVSLMQLGATALGFGSIWLTGINAYDESVKQALQIPEKDHIVGFLYLGTPPDNTPMRKRPDVAEHLREWQG